MTQMDDVLIRHFTLAKEAGMQKDQADRFAAAGYVALKGMLPFHAEAAKINQGSGVTEILLDGTRGSAKSHAVIAQACIDDCQVYPGLKCLFLRKTMKAAGESFEDLVNRVLARVPHQANTEKISFTNGSRVIIGGYSDDGDINKYIGIEYDLIIIEEMTQIRGDQLEMLSGSLRTSKENWTPRLYGTTNPGGIGHMYIKDRFIEPHRSGKETTTRRFYSSYLDNPFINKEYKVYLEGLTGDIAKAWREGDWDIFIGQAFPTFRRDIHVIQPFEIPESWPRWRAVDWGYANPWCCLWGARNPDNGRIIIYREAYNTQLTDRQQARMILDMTPPAERITLTYADPAMWSSKNLQGIVSSTAEEYLAEGVPLTRADNDRLSGKRKIDRLLAPLPDGLPGLQIFENCYNLARTLPQLVRSQTNPEDVDTTGDDHAFDALKYFLTQARDYKPVSRERYKNPWLGAKAL